MLVASRRRRVLHDVPAARSNHALIRESVSKDIPAYEDCWVPSGKWLEFAAHLQQLEAI
jgi:hypothetical protein